MKSRTFEEWIQLYEKKTGTKFEPSPRGTIMFYPERGFAEIGATERYRQARVIFSQRDKFCRKYCLACDLGNLIITIFWEVR